MFFNKCACCGKSGLFQKLNYYNYCTSCEKKLLDEITPFPSGTRLGELPNLEKFLSIRYKLSKSQTWRNQIPLKFLQKFDTASTLYEACIQHLPYIKKRLNRVETVYIIDNDLIVYFGIEDALSPHSTEAEALLYLPIDSYRIKIEELTHNDKFKFIYSSLQKEFDTGYYLFNFIKFIGPPYLNGHQSEYEYLNARLPMLNLDKKYSQWKGWYYKFIIFEINDNQHTEYAIYATDKQNTATIIAKKCEELLSIVFTAMQPKYPDKLFYRTHGAILYTNYFEHTAYNIKLEKRKTEDFSGNNIIKYLIIEENIKNLRFIDDRRNELLTQARQNKFIANEKTEYTPLPHLQRPIQWKSEYTLKIICEKLYGVRNVYFQYRPFFLRQQSYDIYLPKYKIAIEYQGKQHFEPVEYFGGEDSFKNQQRRDKRKLELSKEHDITLIYVNYWEDISPELVNEKVNKVLQEREEK